MSLWSCRLTHLKRGAAEMNKLRGMLLQAVLFILFVALATVDGWGECTYDPRQQYLTGKLKKDYEGCDESLDCSGYVPPSGYYVCNTQMGDQGCRFGSKCPNGWRECTFKYVYCTAYITDNKCEADSLQCIKAGGTWTNTGASTCDGKSCKMSNCLQSDTLWLNDSKAACDAIGGENNYAITDIDETCVHSGICCPPDSALVGNTCKWRCDSLYAACNAKNGYLYAGVLQDTTISGPDSTFTNKCYYNCSYAYNKDSTTSVTDGNTACSSPSTPIADCTRMPNDFSSVRTTYGDSVYSYDFLTPGSAAYIDSIVLTPCSRFMYRCTVNGKYKYWYSDADIPTGCTNIVKIK